MDNIMVDLFCLSSQINVMLLYFCNMFNVIIGKGKLVRIVS